MDIISLIRSFLVNRPRKILSPIAIENEPNAPTSDMAVPPEKAGDQK
jgi:hypothetical protein